MVTKIINAKILQDSVIENKLIYLKGGKIAEISDSNCECDNTIDAKGLYVSPGFIDIHTHGGNGYDFMDGSEAVLNAARLHLQHGTTSICPTTTASSVEVLDKSLSEIKSAISASSDTGLVPNIIGVHLEGPYFSPKQSGAQNPQHITSPIPADYQRLVDKYGSLIKRWSFAPELPGSQAFCAYLAEHHIVPSIAHSDATYEDVLKVCDLGCKLITHLYSAMSTITRVNGFRRLGVIESAYLLDDMTVEVIADGKHLPAELLRLIYKFKGSDSICLVTDSMRGAGLADGPSVIGSLTDGLPCIIEDGVAKLPDRTAFAGSVATADRLIRTMTSVAGVSLTEAVKMMTQTPARVMGLNFKGRIQENYDADLVLFDEDINIQRVILNGKTAVDKTPSSQL